MPIEMRSYPLGTLWNCQGIHLEILGAHMQSSAASSKWPRRPNRRSATEEHGLVYDYGAVQQEIEWEPDLRGEDFEAQQRDQSRPRRYQRAGVIRWSECG